MKFYLAPMESLTGYVMRNAQAHVFGAVDGYVTPFLAPSKKKVLRTRERRDVAPENNYGLCVVPQIMTNQPEQLLQTAEYLYELGYDEVNLNLGCPSMTVVSKKKGAGMLENPQRLAEFFEQTFSMLEQNEKTKKIKLSVKTRLGIEFPEEFLDLIEVYNQFPFSEVIVHPRVQKDFYKNKPRMELFQEGMARLKAPVCYNGDLFTVEQIKKLIELYPDVKRIMLGRGMLTNPGLIREFKSGVQTTQAELKQYHDELLESYLKELKAPKDVLFKMKEHWFYLSKAFEGVEKYLKKIRKANDILSYKVAVDDLFLHGYKCDQIGFFL